MQPQLTQHRAQPRSFCRLALSAPLVGTSGLFSSASAQQDVGEISIRIVGARLVTEGYPFTAALQHVAGHGYGGSLVHSQWVLTAAHWHRMPESLNGDHKQALSMQPFLDRSTGAGCANPSQRANVPPQRSSPPAGTA